MGGWEGGESYVDPQVQENLQGREKRLFTPTSPSTHSLLVLPFSLLSDGYPSLGKCKRGRWILSSSLPLSSREGGERPLCRQHRFKKPKIKILGSGPPPLLFNAILCPPRPSQETMVLQNPFKKQDSRMVTSPLGEHMPAFRATGCRQPGV